LSRLSRATSCTSACLKLSAKYRGRIDLIVNGSFWLGAAAGDL
jgi:hypothetical protein